MMIAGGNIGVTSYGKSLPDGSLSVLHNGNLLISIAEERLTRNKAQGGFQAVYAEFLRSYNIKEKELDLFVLSSCCDLLGAPPVPEFIAGVPYLFCPHHLSHAIGSYVWSGFEEAIVIVLDSGGDVLNALGDTRNWWECEREQHTVFHINQNSHSILKRHATEPNVAGFGELFRAVTFYLGWHAARSSGNTMALSSFGESKSSKNIQFFKKKGNVYKFEVGNKPQNPIEYVQALLGKAGLDGVQNRPANGAFADHHFDIAAAIQKELERYLRILILESVRETNVKNIVITGGVAYNCLALGKLSEQLPELNIFAQPASGDVGQSFGNACYGYFHLTNKMLVMKNKSASLGFNNKSRSILDKAEELKIETKNDPDCSQIANIISSGEIVIVHNGRSEYGPRALGHRSIIAACSEKSNKRRINRLKNRSYFMPVAPVVRIEDANTFFFCQEPKKYMAQVVKLRPEYVDSLRPISHPGDWCRVQTVDAGSNLELYNIIEKVGQQTGVPVVLNTSLNGSDEPICETAEQSVLFMKRYGIRFGWIDGILVTNTEFDENCNHSWSRSKYAEITSHRAKYVGSLKKRLSFMFPDLQIIKRNKFLLNKHFIGWVMRGQKSTTIRFKPDGIEVPSQIVLPLFVSEEFERFHSASRRVGEAKISQITYKAFGDLTDDDASADGFKSLGELTKTIKKIYGNIKLDSIITIYKIDITLDANHGLSI